MSDIIYKYSHPAPLDAAHADIRRLNFDDYRVFCEHLRLCGQNPVSEEIWSEIFSDGTVYFGHFADGKMVARACREIISDEQWEIADVRVVKEYRNCGYAYAICLRVLEYILSEGKTPTIRTDEQNFAMQKVIAKLGFKEM